MTLSFQGTDVTPKRGANLTGRKTTGVRLSVLKKGQKAITIGSDVLAQLNVGDLGDKGIKVVVREGSGAAWGGKLMIQPHAEGPFTLRYVSAKKKSAAHVMSSSLPFAVSDKASYKVYAEDKALVVKIPVAPVAGAAPVAPTADGADADFST